jgi:N-acetylmuramoyl-L-alanine amidase
MVPFRFLGEELQAKISFKINPVSKLVSSIQYELQGTVVILTIGDIQGTVNEKEVLLDAPPIIIKGRTVVPLRFITENLGCKTVWEPNTKSIQVAYAPKS